jgi:DNA-binding NtrC family response regulator
LDRFTTTSIEDRYRRPVVLLVEDETFVRIATADALEDAGFEVIETANATAAQKVFGQRPDIEVLFTDVRMPGPLDGLELARLVCDRWPHVAVVITSGHIQPGSAELPEKAVFIVKPYREHAPARLIRELLESRRASFPGTRSSSPVSRP